MYWPWKWFELYNNCTFWTWKENCLFNLLFWIPNSVCTFHYYGGRHSLLCLPWRHVTNFYYSEFWATRACPEKRVCPENFHCIEIFLSFRIFEQLVLALKNRVPELTVLNIHFLSFRILNNLRLPWKTEFALKFFTLLNILFAIRVFEQLALALKNRVPEFTVLNIYFLSFRILNNLRLPWKTVCSELFHCIEIFLSFRIFEQAALALKTEFALNFSGQGAAAP